MNWDNAKKEIRKTGILLNTRVPSCELGCACVGGWETPKDAVTLWQTGKRFGKYGGYLNHSNLTPEKAVKVLTILNANKVKWEWDGERHHTIGIFLDEVNA